jgi:hypothetical protein
LECLQFGDGAKKGSYDTSTVATNVTFAGISASVLASAAGLVDVGECASWA